MSTIDFLRQFRFLGYAIFDLAASFAGMALLATPLSKLFARFGIIIPRVKWLFLTLPIGILAHVLVGRYTPMTVQFLDSHTHYALKIVILMLTVFGLLGIKKRR